MKYFPQHKTVSFGALELIVLLRIGPGPLVIMLYKECCGCSQHQQQSSTHSLPPTSVCEMRATIGRPALHWQSVFTLPSVNTSRVSRVMSTRFSGSLDDAINNFKDVVTSIPKPWPGTTPDPFKYLKSRNINNLNPDLDYLMEI